MGLEQGQDSAKGLDADKVLSIPATGAESSGRLEQGQVSAIGLVADKGLQIPATGVEFTGYWS